MGNVYNMTNPSQFAGNYAAVGAGVALAGGAAGLKMQNQSGVIINLYAVQQGVQLNIGPQGFTISDEIGKLPGRVRCQSFMAARRCDGLKIGTEASLNVVGPGNISSAPLTPLPGLDLGRVAFPAAISTGQGRVT